MAGFEPATPAQGAATDPRKHTIIIIIIIIIISVIINFSCSSNDKNKYSG